MERIVIIARDEPGIIADVATALGKAGINIESLNTEKAGEQGIITLATDNTNEALHALTNAGFKATTDDPIIFRLPDEPGALAMVAQRFKEAGLNIQSLHILDRMDGQATVRPHHPGPRPGTGPAGPRVHHLRDPARPSPSPNPHRHDQCR